MAKGALAAAAHDLASAAQKGLGDAGSKLSGFMHHSADTADKSLDKALKNEGDVKDSFDKVNPDKSVSGISNARGGSGAFGAHSSGGGQGRGGGGPGRLGTGDGVHDAASPGGQAASKDPVDLVSGEMFLPQSDVSLPGVLPLVLERTHRSGYRMGHSFGRTWAATVDQRVEIDDDGIHFAAADGVVLHYGIPSQPGQKVQPAEGARWPLSWDLKTDTIVVEQPEAGLTLHFPPGPIPETHRPLAVMTDRSGNRVTYVYNADGVPTDVYHSGGYHLVLESQYTRGGARIRAIALADPRGGADTPLVSFGYDVGGRLVETFNSSGRPLEFEYDDQDRITSWADRNGYRYGYEYGPDGRVVRAEGTDGYLAADFAYDPEAGTTWITDSLGGVTEYHWNERLQIVRVVDQLGGESRTEQDRYGRVLSYTDELGAVTKIDRNAYGDPVRIERPDGRAIELVYGEPHHAVQVTEPDGAVWRYAYDECGRVARVTDPAGAQSAFEYSDHGALSAAIDPLGNAVRYEADQAGLPLAITDPGAGLTRLERDAFGRPTAVTDPLGVVTKAGWNADGRLAWTEAADGAREQWSYDVEGNLLEHRARGGAATTYEYGPFDKVTARTDATGARYEFGYDTELRISRVLSPAGQAWQYGYDAVGRLVSEVDFSGRALAYRVDGAGRISERINALGQRTVYRRDAMGRLLARDAGEDSGSAAFSYDACGRLLRAESADAVLEYTRDRLGRVLSESLDGRVTAFEYDLAGRLLRRRTPAEVVTEWVYDAAGRFTQMTGTAGLLAVERDLAGREVTRRLGPLAALGNTYDEVGRVSAMAVWVYDQAGVEQPRHAQYRTYLYRADGAPVEVTDGLRGATAYTLDALGRVTGVRAEDWSETYAYDGGGSPVHTTLPGDQDTSGERENAGNRPIRAGRTSHEYDGDGRLIRTRRRTLSGQTRETVYRWDTEGRLTGLTSPDGRIWRYLYDALGRRIAKKRVDGHGAVVEEVWFTWDGDRVAEQVSSRADGSAQALTWDYEPGGHRPVAQTRTRWAAGAPQSEVDREFHAIVTDLVGTATELVDERGAVAWHRPAATLWGSPVEAGGPEQDDAVQCPLRFPGQYHDPESGLHYNLHRYYNPETGVYLSPDPLGLEPAPDDFGYVLNPLTWFDPLGLNPYQTTPEDVFGFGNASGPKGGRPSDFGVANGSDEIGPYPSGAGKYNGASTFTSAGLDKAPLSGKYHKLPAGTELPDDLGFCADGKDVAGGTMSFGHRTIYPKQPMSVDSFVDKVKGLPWTNKDENGNVFNKGGGKKKK
ncbi:MAG: RHS repeat-associated core domain-containing protein [Actinocrinis sp.]